MNLVDTIVVPRGEGRGFVVRTAQILRVKQPEGGQQVGDFNAWNLHDPRERFWGSRTALYHGMHLHKGDQLHSTWPGERPMFTIVEDTIKRRKSARGALQHDVVLGRCSQKYRVKRYGAETPGCQEILASSVAQFNLDSQHVHDAFNLFMYTGLDENDRFFFDVSDAKEGDYVDLRAEIDCIVAISSCPGACTGPDAKGLICEIYKE
jgi:uncharacterized protein YcgI (DUF1989 family)